MSTPAPISPPTPWRGRPGPSRALHAGLVVAAVIILVLHAWHYRWTWTDDAYITFRYARNLVTGHGMVFNPGEHFEGLTNLGWAILLAPFAHGDVLGAARWIGLACAAGTVVSVGAWARCMGLGLAATATGLAALVVAPWLPYWSVQGMETSAVTLLLTVGWTRHCREVKQPRGPLLSGLALGLGPAIRPDAVLGAAVVGVWHLVRRGGPKWSRRVGWSVGGVVLLGLGLVALKLSWFGSVLPNPFYVKTGAGALERGVRYLERLATVPSPALPMLLCVGVVVGLGLAVRRDDRSLPALLGVAWLGMVAAVGGDFMANFRLIVPIWPALAAALAVAVDLVVRAAERRAAAGVSDIFALGALLAVGGALWVPAGLDRVDRLNQEPVPVVSTKTARLLTPWEGRVQGVGLEPSMPWTTAFALVHASASAPVATTDIGLIAWVNDQVPVVDLLALTDSVMAGRNAERWPAQWTYLSDRLHFMVLDSEGGAWSRYRDSLARDGWRVVGTCDSVWALANPAVGQEAAPLLPELELQRRLDDLLQRSPDTAALHEAVARELADAGAAPSLVLHWVDQLSVHHGPSWQAGAGAQLRCDLGLSAATCSPNPAACGRRVSRTVLADWQDSAAWPGGERGGEGGPPQDPEQAEVRLPDGAAPGNEAVSRGMFLDDARACEAARGTASEAWEAAAPMWEREDGRRKNRPQRLARLAARRALAAPREARETARVAWREAAAVTSETLEWDEAVARSRTAFDASEAAWSACRAGALPSSPNPEERAGPD